MSAETKLAGRPLTTDRIFNINVIVAALGYFVDIYDLLLFGIVRVASLKAIGVPEAQLMDQGLFLINAQMIGMLIGGVIWGVVGDRKGRVSVLFGSIALYSLANIANAFVTTVEMYGVLRFIAGIGLAGELGAAITLVSETMTKESRGYGTTVVASVGLIGAVVAALVGEMFDWKVAYIVGGIMGLLLLVVRVSMFESGMFEEVKGSHIRKGDLRMLFTPIDRFFRYLRCIAIGIPVWFVVGILITFSPELSRALEVQGVISAGQAIMYSYAGLAIGDLASGWLSQHFRNRRMIVAGFLALTLALILVYLFSSGLSVVQFYVLCALLGFSAGYWAIFVTIAAEQFGTNLRATVTTSVPNFVRGSVVPITLSFKYLSDSLGLIHGALIVGIASLVIAYVALWYMQETWGKDLNYSEHH